MHPFPARLGLLAALPLLLGLAATPASATPDVSGQWLFYYQSTQFGPGQWVETLSQSGTTLSMQSGLLSGPIDPETGVFSLSGVYRCLSLENPLGVDVPVSQSGTFSPDGESVTGDFYHAFQSGRACYIASGTFIGVRYVPTTTIPTTSSTTIPTTSSTTITTTSTSTSVTTSTTTTTLPSTRLELHALRLADPTSASRRKLVLDARDGHVAVDPADDPTLHGGALRVRTPESDDTYPLPAANWTRTSSGYRYRDTRQVDGPITVVDVKVGRQLKAVGKGAGLGTTLDVDPRPVQVVVRLGGHQFCLEAWQGGGKYVFKPGKFTALDVDPPVRCPVP